MVRPHPTQTRATARILPLTSVSIRDSGYLAAHSWCSAHPARDGRATPPAWRDWHHGRHAQTLRLPAGHRHRCPCRRHLAAIRQRADEDATVRPCAINRGSQAPLPLCTDTFLDFLDYRYCGASLSFSHQSCFSSSAIRASAAVTHSSATSSPVTAIGRYHSPALPPRPARSTTAGASCLPHP